ncbi:MAG: helix-turn-helix domain-containing protein [Dehalococcoidia bacterium]
MRCRQGEPLLDTRPEYYPYRDDGCEVSPSCLICPLPKCKYDDPGWLQRERRRGRDLEVLRVRQAQTLSVPQLAQRFGISQRTVFRILSRALPVQEGRADPDSRG